MNEHTHAHTQTSILYFVVLTKVTGQHMIIVQDQRNYILLYLNWMGTLKTGDTPAWDWPLGLEPDVSFLCISCDRKAPLLHRVWKHTESMLKHRMVPESCSSTPPRTHLRAPQCEGARRTVQKLLQSSVKYSAISHIFNFIRSLTNLRSWQSGRILLCVSPWPLKCVIFSLYSGARLKSISGGR